MVLSKMKFSDSKIVQNIAKWKRKWKGYPDWAVLELPDVKSELRLEYAVSDNGWVPVSDGLRFIYDYLVFKILYFTTLKFSLPSKPQNNDGIVIIIQNRIILCKIKWKPRSYVIFTLYCVHLLYWWFGSRQWGRYIPGRDRLKQKLNKFGP